MTGAPVPVRVLCARTIANVSPGLSRALSLDPGQNSIALLATDCDDVDVYKRQVQVRIARDAAGQLCEQRLDGPRLHRLCLQRLGAHTVSYTHLDVYKRQA